MTSIKSSLLFVCGAARVKSIRIEQGVDQEPLTFCTQRCASKKYKDRT
jgi:hypothetical protein